MPLTLTCHNRKIADELNEPLLTERLERLMQRLCLDHKNINMVFMTDREIAGYNTKYRGKEGPTNVLSFPAAAGNEILPSELIQNELGDVLISVDTAVREARATRKSLHDRLTELSIHGLLHLMGFDHERSPEEAEAMWKREQELFHYLTHPRRTTMVHLAVNVDHVATVREARGTDEPDPVTAAAVCELAGAAGIVVHLREDRRHIQDRDVRLLRQTVKTRLNLEMAATGEMLDIALDIGPDMVTLVPEKRKELTTEGGLNVRGNRKKITRAIDRLSKKNIPVSLFIDPDAKQIKASREAGATFVELHTGRYCDAGNAKKLEREFGLIEESAALARDLGLRVNAGHGLDYRNTARIAALETIEELSIGHAIISRAVFVGLDQAVREMLEIVKPPFPGH